MPRIEDPATMPVTLTIKQVPQRLADGLRRRAAANRRSQQQELLLMLEHVIGAGIPVGGVGEPSHAVYRTDTAQRTKRARKRAAGKATPSRNDAEKLGLDALWQRARKLGAGMPSESSAIVRADRDAGRR